MASGGTRKEIPLETGEHFADFIGLAQVGHGVGNGVVIFQPQQRRQFGLIQFLHADGDVVRQDEIKERLLLGVELGIDMHPRLVGPRRPRDRRQR